MDLKEEYAQKVEGPAGGTVRILFALVIIFLVLVGYNLLPPSLAPLGTYGIPFLLGIASLVLIWGVYLQLTSGVSRMFQKVGGSFANWTLARREDNPKRYWLNIAANIFFCLVAVTLFVVFLIPVFR